MAQNIILQGDVIQVTAPSGGITSGNGFLIGTMVGIALNTAAEAATADVTLVGVGLVAKATSQAWTQGAAVYWDDTNKKFTTTSSGNTLAGNAWIAAGSADTTGYVRLRN